MTSSTTSAALEPVRAAGSPLAHERHQRAAGRVRQRPRERQQPVVDRRIDVDEDVAHQPTRAPRSRSTATICAATCSASPSSIVA